MSDKRVRLLPEYFTWYRDNIGKPLKLKDTGYVKFQHDDGSYHYNDGDGRGADRVPARFIEFLEGGKPEADKP